MSSKCVIQINDKDTMKDEIVGSIILNLNDYIDDRNMNGKIVWMNIYGSPLGFSGSNTDMMD